MDELEMLSEVAVLRDLPEHGLVRGQVGTVVEVHSPEAAEIEFVDDEGRTYALIALGRGEVMRLHHRRLSEVA